MHTLVFSGAKVEYERTVYSIFDMLADVGGLNGSLSLICAWLLSFFTPLIFVARQTSQLFFYDSKDDDDNDK